LRFYDFIKLSGFIPILIFEIKQNLLYSKKSTISMRKVQIILSVLFIFTLNSCSLEKRYHSSGYNINWQFTTANHERKASPKTSKLSNVSSDASQTSTVKMGSIGISNKSVVTDPSINSELQNSGTSQTTNQTQIELIAPKNAHTEFSDNSNQGISSLSNIYTNRDFKGQMSSFKRNSNNSSFFIFSKNDKSILKNDNQNESGVKTTKQEQLENSGNSGTGTRVFGTLLIIMGVIFIIFVSIILGFILIALGILLRAVAGPKHKPTPTPVVATQPQTEEKKVEFVDVVYLKNGSIIKGLIMEQIPNESLKIQTSDGSLFVYKMEEVVKITKEEKK